MYKRTEPGVVTVGRTNLVLRDHVSNTSINDFPQKRNTAKKVKDKGRKKNTELMINAALLVIFTKKGKYR